MSSTEDTRKLLNHLVDEEYSAEISGCFSQSALLRWGEEMVEKNSLGKPILYEVEPGVMKERRIIFPKLSLKDWYMFEIGRNCGTVFSADCVKSVEIKGHHAIIHLKG